jgi:hypothetical protein
MKTCLNILLQAIFIYILKFCDVLNVVFFLLGDSLAPKSYTPTEYSKTSAYKIQMPGTTRKKEYNFFLFCISMQAHVASPEKTIF